MFLLHTCIGAMWMRIQVFKKPTHQSRRPLNQLLVFDSYIFNAYFLLSSSYSCSFIRTFFYFVHFGRVPIPFFSFFHLEWLLKCVHEHMWTAKQGRRTHAKYEWSEKKSNRIKIECIENAWIKWKRRVWRWSAHEVRCIEWLERAFLESLLLRTANTLISGLICRFRPRNVRCFEGRESCLNLHNSPTPHRRSQEQIR